MLIVSMNVILAISLMSLRRILLVKGVQMLEMDGYEAARRIRAIEAERNFGVNFTECDNNGMEFPKETQKTSCTSFTKSDNKSITAKVFREDIEKRFDAGMDSHAGKPLDFNEVYDKLISDLAK